MKKSRLTLLVLLCSVLTIGGYSAPSVAGSVTVIRGPYPDFVGVVPVGVAVTIPTRGAFVVPVPPLPPFLWPIFRFRDRITVAVVVPVPVFAATFASSTYCIVGDPVFCPNQTVTLTDVYGLDLGGTLGGPNGDVPMLTGFDPLGSQINPIGPEEFIGNSGTIYPGNVVPSTLAGLATLLPGFDLSQFTGDPNSIVFVAQANNVPLDDVTVPEPSSLALLAIGILGFCRRFGARQRRFVG